MTVKISHLSQVDARAELGDGVEIGPFCCVGPHVRLGNGCRLDSHVVIVGHTTVGERNRFWPGTVIGGEPQDLGYKDAPTRLEIGDDNLFREGVTINRGAEKEDHVTRIGNNNMFMAGAHVGHNCHIRNRVLLVNGVMLGGHVHAHDGAIVSGNTAVHHFVTLGTLSFVGGQCRVVRDIPPYMMSVGADDPAIETINSVGMRRSGMSPETIALLKRAHRLLFRENKSLNTVRDQFLEELDGVFPLELSHLFNFMEQTRKGRLGRAREAFRDKPPQSQDQSLRRAA